MWRSFIRKVLFSEIFSVVCIMGLGIPKKPITVPLQSIADGLDIITLAKISKRRSSICGEGADRIAGPA